MISRLFCLVAIFANASAASVRIQRQTVDQVESSGAQLPTANFDQAVFETNSDVEGSGTQLQFINFNENPDKFEQNVDVEGSGAHLQFVNFDEAANQQAIRDPKKNSPCQNSESFFLQENLTSDTPSNVHEVTVNLTERAVNTLVITVHLPTISNGQLLEELKNETLDETHLPTKLETAVSLTEMLGELLERIQTASVDEPTKRR
ncbi:unnamed protein product [Caenorhabditis bovis]|uniref:Uncharacterized protein n=1 Tax=Caenorhabditis bovis TaxID=2654633 RepID=A0A8S1EY21_9PELO|nr:unnamed protein product [Caenorhabditis bovis]